MAGVFTADDKMEKRKKNVREYLLIAYSTYFSTQKKKNPETSRLKELKDKKNLDNKSKAYFGLSIDFYTFLRPSWTMEMFIICISNEE